MTLYTFIFRISVCFILSILIGIERQYRHKTVGLRTNVLVCLGAFMFVILSFQTKNSDVTRIAAQVVSGIGFLGAGIILKDGNRVKGLNTAATLWCVSSIGVLSAAGLLVEASIGTAFVLISNILLRLISKKIMDKVTTGEEGIITVECKNSEIANVKNIVSKLSNKYNLIIKKFDKTNLDNHIILKIVIIADEETYFDEIIKNITINCDIDYCNLEHNKIINSDNEDIDDE